MAPYLLVGPNRETQSPYLTPALDTSDDVLKTVKACVLKHLAEPLTPADLASVANVSVRTLFRRFQTLTQATPLDYVQAVVGGDAESDRHDYPAVRV